MFKPCDVLECLWHLDSFVPSIGRACILMKQHGIRGGKYLLKTPGDAISETLIFKMSLDASALKNLCLWCKFQSCLLFIISLLLKNILTALTRQSTVATFSICYFKSPSTAVYLWRHFKHNHSKIQSL